MQIVRQLLDKIEKVKLPSLTDKVEESKVDFKFSDGQKIIKETPTDPFAAVPTSGELDFLEKAANPTSSFNPPVQM